MPAFLIESQLNPRQSSSADAPRNAFIDGPSIWNPATHVKDLDEVLSAWFWLDLNLAMLRVNKWLEDTTLFFLVSVTLTFK